MFEMDPMDPMNLKCLSRTLAENLMESMLEVYKGCNLAIAIPNNRGRPLVREKRDEIRGFEMKSATQEIFMMAKLKREFIPKKSFEEIRQDMTNLGNGIFKKTLAEGYGGPMKEGSQLTLMYSIYLENASSVYDSSYLAHRPCLIVLGEEDGILPGFDRALRSMRNQEKAAFIVPRLLYADNKDYIPPTENELKNAYLVIEMIRVADPEDTKEKSRVLCNPALTLKHIEELRDKGKAAFSARFYRVAVDWYLEAVFVLRNTFMPTLAENEKRLQLLIRMYLNAGVVYNKMEQYNFAHYMLKRAIQLLQKHVQASDALKGKIYFHASRTLRMQKVLTQSFISLKEAEKFLGPVQEIKDEFQLIYQAARRENIRTTFFVDPVGEAMGKESGFLSWLNETTGSNKSKIFEVAFEQMLQTFLRSQERKKTVYGVYSEENIEMAKEVVMGKKVDLEVLENNDTVSYILTKK